MENETVWLTQAQMADLFQTDRTSIVRHVNNIYKSEELEREVQREFEDLMTLAD